MKDRLPIDAVLGQLVDALRDTGRAVLQAPPGAGKTTRVPLAMLEANLCAGRIVMLEPRRLAARAAAERMAQTLGEPVGQTVGYRIRGEAKTSRTTRIEVVTEGILTRMIQSDPGLSGVDAVIFDEFHERSLNGDLGLALAWEIRGALREDLMLVVMSATLDAGPVAAVLDDAPVITSEGRAFEVETRWLERPLARDARFEPALADLVISAVSQTSGGVLVFAPGEGEIRRVEKLLAGRLPGDCVVQPLFGAMPFDAQRAAIMPLGKGKGRKVVLATSIAETSLTIEDIRVVVDGGRARRARFDPGAGMSRLVTERVTKAEAEQRRGRAGRVAPGMCFRLWTRGEEGGMQAFAPAEIEVADLAGLVLELALWGAEPGQLGFLTPPNAGAFAEAQALLRQLGALDDAGAITTEGRAIAAMPLHPRLGSMLYGAGAQAAPLAAVLSERDPLERGAPVDLQLRLEAMADLARFTRERPHKVNRPVLDRTRAEAKRLTRLAKGDTAPKMRPAEMLGLAYPDRIARRRKGEAPRYVMAGGKGAILPETDPMAQAEFIVAADLDGNPREARIRLALASSAAEIRAFHGEAIEHVRSCEWSRRDGRVLALDQERLGAAVLEERIWKDATPEAIARAALDGVRDVGLRVEGAAALLAARVELVRADGADMPDMSAEGLLADADEWLLPHLGKVRNTGDIRALKLHDVLRNRMSWDQLQALEAAAPAHFTTPLGNRIAIDYGGEAPAIEVRLQEMFGVIRHPVVAGKPLRVTLLSPARRPVQVTMDLPGFWANSYADVRKDMRGQYPKHPWPEDPTEATPTLRAKPRSR